MGYRRLPNTDKSRIQSIKVLMECVDAGRMELEGYQKKINYWNENFCQIILKRELLKKERAELNAKKKELITELSLYISHFIQVLNFAIVRGDIEKDCRSFV